MSHIVLLTGEGAPKTISQAAITKSPVYNAFLDDFIFRLPGVSQVRSNIVLKEIKADTALPFKV